MGLPVVSAWSGAQAAGRAGGLQEPLLCQPRGLGQVPTPLGRRLPCGLSAESGYLWPRLCHCWPGEARLPGQGLLICLSPRRKVEDLQFRVEEESITKGDLEVTVKGPASGLLGTPGPALIGPVAMRSRQQPWASWEGAVGILREK